MATNSTLVEGHLPVHRFSLQSSIVSTKRESTSERDQLGSWTRRCMPIRGCWMILLMGRTRDVVRMDSLRFLGKFFLSLFFCENAMMKIECWFFCRTDGIQLRVLVLLITQRCWSIIWDYHSVFEDKVWSRGHMIMFWWPFGLNSDEGPDVCIFNYIIHTIYQYCTRLPDIWNLDVHTMIKTWIQ